MKKINTIFLLCVSSILFAQVGVNTETPRQIFHIDAFNNTPATGTPTADQLIDDVVVTVNGLVGIGVIQPEKSLDVNALNEPIRLRNLQLLSSFPTTGPSDLLERNAVTGDVRSIKVLFPSSQSIAPNISHDFIVPSIHNVHSGMITVSLSNSCGRSMMAQFAFSGNSLYFLGGMGRDVIGIGAIGGAPLTNLDSVMWQIRFPAVIGCADGGSEDQFNFDIKKIDNQTFRVTSRSNIVKTYGFLVQRT